MIRPVFSLHALTGLVALAGLLLAGALAARADSAVPLTPEQRQTVADIDAYLNGLRSVKGRFTQIGPNGEFSEGDFFLVRPGRIRFDYADPNPILVVADGFWVGIQDRKLNTVEKYPLAATPLRLLLSDNVDLLKDARLTDFQSEPGQIRLTLEDPRGTAPGQLTVILGEPSLTLKQWVVIDAQGLRTEVTLFDLVTDATLSKRLFFIDDSGLYDRSTKH